MPSWWGRFSPKNGKRKSKRESFFEALNRRLRFSSARTANQSEVTRRRHNDSNSERGFRTWVLSTPPSPSAVVSRCQSFAGTSLAQPLPLPRANSPAIGRTDSGILRSDKPEEDLDSRQLLLSTPPDADSVGNADAEGDLATASISSDSSIDSDDPSDSRLLSPLTSDHESGIKTATNSPSSTKHRNQSAINHKTKADSLEPSIVSRSNQDRHFPLTSPKRRPLFTDMQSPQHGVLSSAVEDITLLGSGQCSSPGSGSGHNSIGGDFSGQYLWPQNRCSAECSPVPSPRMTSPGPSSRIHSAAVTPLHPRAGGPISESPMIRPEDNIQRSHRLPLPPITIPNNCLFSLNYPRATSPPIPRSPARPEMPVSPGSRWKKGRLLGRGSFGHVYVGFDRESGEMCAMKEVTLFPDDPKSKESAQQLNQEIAMLSRLRHPNIVRYYGSETMGDKLYIYLEYVSGGSIYKLLQEYGKFGENAIRSYTQQILSGLAYLHSKNTIHRDIKGANILVDPSGRVKLADFGMAKHITGQYCPLSFKGSPYWMAPEVIRNSNGYNVAVDIWSLGCTVLEMATAKPPWSQYEGVAAMFKIGNSKELPEIPDHLSDEGKDFVKLCLQRNPSTRPSAAQLLEHPFVKNGAPLEKHVIAADNLEVTLTINNTDILNARNLPSFESEDTQNHQPKGLKIASGTSTPLAPSFLSSPISPTGSPILRSRSPQHMRGMVSPPISSPHSRSGATTPLTGGNGGVALHLQQQQPGVGPGPVLPSSFYSGNLYQDHSDSDLSRRWSQPARVLQEMILSGHGEPTSSNNGQSLLADHVSRQLLGEELSFMQYLDQKQSCLPPARVYRT